MVLSMKIWSGKSYTNGVKAALRTLQASSFFATSNWTSFYATWSQFQLSGKAAVTALGLLALQNLQNS